MDTTHHNLFPTKTVNLKNINTGNKAMRIIESILVKYRKPLGQLQLLKGVNDAIGPSIVKG